ncbi:MAG: hypothetical protein A2Z27_03900 [candidate division Zixibacteria bacterium RBG_16_50_21]|nr:MAG: hypothetical protein A2Z27_03900 [candidate division Zixibacteria bacterium RBG_16_50_21]
MRRPLVCLVILGLLALPGVVSAKGIDFYDLFPNLVLGSDPGGTDTVAVANGGLTPTQQIIEIQVETDNADSADFLQGIQVDILLEADCQGVTLDTTVNTVFSGTAVSGWGIRSVQLSGDGDPSTFPKTLRLGAVELGNTDAGDPLPPGDHLFAKLVFSLSEPCNICGTFTFDDPTMLVTVSANGYQPAAVNGCFGPVVPTLTEWGLIFFGFLLLIGLVWYVRNRKVAVRV